jgi:predicted DNA-binding transcriptional regulator AlpA
VAVRPELAHVQLLDAREVAGLLRVSMPTLWRCVKQERMPKPIRFGPRLLRWRLRDIERFLGAERPQRVNETAMVKTSMVSEHLS